MTYDAASAAGDRDRESRVAGQRDETADDQPELPADVTDFLAGLDVEPDEVDTDALLSEERELEDDLKRVAHERDSYLDALRRLQADFDNHRKRTRRDQEEIRERASEQVMVDLLPVLDALDLAAAHASSEDAAAIGQIAMLLRDTVHRHGLQRIDAAGVEFDPMVHDAVAHEPAAPDDASGIDGVGDENGTSAASAAFGHTTTVVDVLRPGYSLKGKVLRPAMVRVRG